jgi:hypothetical protein
LTGGADDPCVNPWASERHANIVDQIPGFEIIRPIENDIDSLQQLDRVAMGQIADFRLNMYLGVDSRDMIRSRNRFRQVIFGVVLRIECLPWQVVEFDPIPVDQPYPSDTASS